MMACALAACSASHASSGAARAVTAGWTSAARTRMPSAPVAVLASSSPGTVTGQLAAMMFSIAPVVVVADVGASATTAAGAARAARAPLLVAALGQAASLAPAAQALHPSAVLAVGLPAAEQAALAAALPGVKVVASPHQLPATAAPSPLSKVDVLVPAPAAPGTASPSATPGATATPSATPGTSGSDSDSGSDGTSGSASPAATGTPAATGSPSGGATPSVSASDTAAMVTAGSAEDSAATATAEAAGATVIDVPGGDPRSDPAVISALARQRPGAVIGVGAEFGSVAELTSRVAVAETGTQLPGGGQVLFPGRQLVALYGHPDTPALGVLGQQDLAASITRVQGLVAQYKALSSGPVVPAFEIIASVAEGSPGPGGDYTYETPVSDLLPWVKQASADGIYVVLDLQPGRANFLDQAKAYQSLLQLPDVGLGLDSEWKLQPDQKPLEQIGHVDISEVNDVLSWLADLTAQYHLPQKLVVLHQFQLQMLRDESDLDTSHDDLSILIHMDGQGTQGDKQGTWNAVLGAAPPGVFFGWKNFLVKDHPMLTPSQTMTVKPAPVMITYQ
jgi:hypothetical protein